MTKVLIIRFLVVMWYGIITYFYACGVMDDDRFVKAFSKDPGLRMLPKWVVLAITVFVCSLWPIWLLRSLRRIPTKVKKHILRSKSKTDGDKNKSTDNGEDWRNYWRN